MCACIKKRVFCQGARCHKAHHLAPNDRFGATLLRLCRIFGLFADDDPEAFTNKALKIGVSGMHRHATHGNVFAQMFAAFGERDVEGACGRNRIFKKELIEIAHPIEQKRVLLTGFQLQILRHHGRDGIGLARGRFFVFLRRTHGPGRYQIQGRSEMRSAAKSLFWSYSRGLTAP